MNKFTSVLLVLTPFVSGTVHAEGLGLFDRSAAFGLGVATRSVEKAVELDAEKRASENPEEAARIRLKSKAVLGVLGKTDEKLFKAAIGDHEVPDFPDLEDDAGANSDLSHEPDPKAIEVGIYRNLITLPNNRNTVIYTLPSEKWLKHHGIDINRAVAIRIPISGTIKTESGRILPITDNEDGRTFKLVMLGDLKNLRYILERAGADPYEVKDKIEEIMNLGNDVYSEFLVKRRYRKI